MIRYILSSLLSMLLFTACGDSDGNDNNGGTPPPEPPTPAAFALGADISWVTEQEKDGVRFYNASGKATDCFALMREIGMNAIRLRVWVNPSAPAQAGANDGGYGSAYCGKDDVVAKAVRAKQAGMDVMIDFHYSNLFADPGRQLTPNEWRGKSLDELKGLVANHTKDVLGALLAAGVTPRWIQIGNETRNGMLHPTGQLWNNNGDIKDGWANYAALTNAGYDAAKAVCPEATVMVHIDNAWEDNKWWFDRLRAAGGKFDMIGLSHYPMVTGKVTWQQANKLALEHIRQWAAEYKVPVMVVEVGVKPVESDAARCLSEFMTEVRTIDGCKGVFYWEPQVFNGWRPSVYRTVFKWGAYDMGAFSKDGRPLPLLDVFKQ